MQSFPTIIEEVLSGNIARSLSEELKVYLLIAAVLLVICWNLLSRSRAHKILIVLCVLATMNYARFGTKLLVNKVDSYDLMHYYINPKYFDQLGYYDLYPAVMLVDHENGGPYFQEGTKYLAQDDSGHNMKPIPHGLARGREIKKKFSPDEWTHFTEDVLWLQRESTGFTSKLWRQMRLPNSYNICRENTVLVREPIRKGHMGYEQMCLE